MTKITDLKIIVVPTEGDSDINPNSTFQELMKALEDEEDGVIEYDLGRYMQDQNEEELPLHWSFLVDRKGKRILNGMFNTQIEHGNG